ncbi:cupin-like domain-containing protein [Phthorimaea operculella]|nr:cupin-like domain-containing protein [Phthorimaea operculella]
MTTASEMYVKLREYMPQVCSSLEEIEELNLACKSIIHRYLDNIEATVPSDMIKIQGVIDYMYDQVNIGNFREVRKFLRKTITMASYLKLLIHFKCATEITEQMVKEAFKIIDFGIMFGCPIDSDKKLLQNCAMKLGPLHCTPLGELSANIANNNNDTVNAANVDMVKNNIIPLEVLDCPSMEHFYTNYIKKEQPVVLANCIDHWPALTKWKDQNYFIKIAGMRTVPIELGKDYTDFDWTQKLMTMEEFIKNHIYQTNGPVGYLAQYELFVQIPELREDIIEPDYCAFSESGNPADVMAWYGPKGTVSPLHHDPKKNLLVQVVGEKQLFLYSPKDSEYVYPHEHELLGNTARIDPRNPDLEKYPNYKNATAYYCVLRPGQMLYIPPKWWHFVESLSVSFSVSFWWE